jgi:glutathione S-transferase
MAIKIYGDPGSGSLRRVTTAAKIMGIEIERVNVDLFKGESQTDEFKSRLNPHGLTPVLEDGDFILYEAAAINLYLANKVNSPLVGTTEKDRFQVLQWMFWSGEQWRIFATTLFDERVGKTVMGLPKNEPVIAFAEGKFRAAAKVLDQHLEGRKFMVGQAPTLADFDIAGPSPRSIVQSLPSGTIRTSWPGTTISSSRSRSGRRRRLRLTTVSTASWRASA